MPQIRAACAQKEKIYIYCTGLGREKQDVFSPILFHSPGADLGESTRNFTEFPPSGRKICLPFPRLSTISTLRAGEKKALSGAPAPRPARLCAGAAACEIRPKPSESRQIGQFRGLSNGCQYGILIPSREREGPDTQNSERKRFHMFLRPQGGGTAGSGKSRGSSPPEAGKNQ